MKVNKDSSYYERLEYAELAKLKSEYKELGFVISEEYTVKLNAKTKIICDLFLENKQTGEKIVFEVKARRPGMNKEFSRDIVQKRNSIKKAIPGVKVFIRVIEEPRKNENSFFGIESMLTYLLKFRYEDELSEKIGSKFGISKYKDIILPSIKIKERSISLSGSGCAQLVYDNIELKNVSNFPDMIYFDFRIQIENLHHVWEFPFLRHLKQSLEQGDPIFDKYIKSEFKFDW